MNKTQYADAMHRIERLMNAHPTVGSAAGNELDLLAHAAEIYENKHYDIGYLPMLADRS